MFLIYNTALLKLSGLTDMLGTEWMAGNNKMDPTSSNVRECTVNFSRKIIYHIVS